MGLISRNIDYNNRYLDQFDFATQIIEAKDMSKVDTLGEIAINLIRYSDFHRASNIYETIVNSGQLKLLNNNEVYNDAINKINAIIGLIDKELNNKN